VQERIGCTTLRPSLLPVYWRFCPQYACSDSRRIRVICFVFFPENNEDLYNRIPCCGSMLPTRVTLDRGCRRWVVYVSSKHKPPASTLYIGCNAIPSHPHARLCHLQPHRAHRYFPHQIALFCDTFSLKARKTSISVVKLKLSHSVTPNRLRNELQIARKISYFAANIVANNFVDLHVFGAHKQHTFQ